MSLKIWIAWIDAFGRESQQKTFVELQSRLLQHRQQNFVSRAGISRRFENHELPATQALLERFGGSENERDIRLFGFPQRRGHANDDRVALFQMIEISCRAQTTRVNQLFHQRRRDVTDVRLTGVDLRGLSFVNFEPDGVESPAGKLSQERQTNVAEPNHADARTLVPNQIDDFVFDHEMVLRSVADKS